MERCDFGHVNEQTVSLRICSCVLDFEDVDCVRYDVRLQLRVHLLIVCAYMYYNGDDCSALSFR